jgi:hypothetical protein
MVDFIDIFKVLNIIGFMSTGGIDIYVLGDFGPFSRTGKSIGYLVRVGGSCFLVDCGAPLFNQIGGHGLKEIDGLIITHCHDDHKRWFSDLALFHMYVPDIDRKVMLMASEHVHQDLKEASAPAIDRSLSMDSKEIVDIAYEQYVDYRIIGPKAKYSIVQRDNGEGTRALRIVDSDGNPVGPDRAKIVISSKTGRPRMLFKDLEYNEWVEPESFYPFSSETFYESNRMEYRGEDFLIEALKAPVWHGIPGIGIRI